MVDAGAVGKKASGQRIAGVGALVNFGGSAGGKKNMGNAQKWESQNQMQRFHRRGLLEIVFKKVV